MFLSCSLSFYCLVIVSFFPVLFLLFPSYFLSVMELPFCKVLEGQSAIVFLRA